MEIRRSCLLYSRFLCHSIRPKGISSQATIDETPLSFWQSIVSIRESQIVAFFWLGAARTGEEIGDAGGQGHGPSSIFEYAAFTTFQWKGRWCVWQSGEVIVLFVSDQCKEILGRTFWDFSLRFRKS
jgi:hypothetical protein